MKRALPYVVLAVFALVVAALLLVPASPEPDAVRPRAMSARPAPTAPRRPDPRAVPDAPRPPPSDPKVPATADPEGSVEVRCVLADGVVTAPARVVVMVGAGGRWAGRTIDVDLSSGALRFPIQPEAAANAPAKPKLLVQGHPPVELSLHVDGERVTCDEVALPEGAALAVVVQPPGERIRVIACGEQLSTDADGTVRFPSLPVGRCDVVARRNDGGYIAESEVASLTLAAGEEAELTLSLPATRLRGLGAAVDTDPGGIRLIGLPADSAAAAAGLREGELVVAVDGAPTESWSRGDWYTATSSESDEPFVLTVRRGGRDVDIPVTPAPVTGDDCSASGCSSATRVK